MSIKWEYEIDPKIGLTVLKSKKDPYAIEKLIKLSDKLFGTSPSCTKGEDK